MLDDFFVRALLAGIGVSLVAGPFGCMIVWRRMAFFGDTLAHAALLGVVIALLLQVNHVIVVFLFSATISLLLFALQRWLAISSDSLLGILSHSSLAIGLVSLAFMTWIRVDLMGFLFGDILAVSKMDLLIIYGGSILALAILFKLWNRLFAATVNNELALAEGLGPDKSNLVFVLLLALVVAIAMKIVGVLLITAMLIIPAATARRFAGSPEQMALFAILIGIVSVFAGLYGSLYLDSPSGPSIIVAAFVCFVLSILPSFGRLRRLLESDGRLR